MRKLHIILNIFVLTLLAFLMSGCSDDGISRAELNEGEASYLRIQLVVPQTTRADSHPDEPALAAENSVRNITVFFYKDPQGLNGDRNTPIYKSAYVDRAFLLNGNVLTAYVMLDEGDTFGAQDRVAVTVNMGNLTRLRTLGELQDYTPTATWQTGAEGVPSECEFFSMASAYNYDGSLVYVEDKKDRYYTTEVSVERTAARIDLAYNANQRKDGYLEYSSRSAANDSEVNGQVRLYGITPINAMQQPSYALKRISNGLSDDFSCFNAWRYTGTLTNGNELPQAYVLEPHTTAKTDGATVPDDWYGTSATAFLNNTQWDAAGTLNIADLTGDPKTNFNADGSQVAVVAYTNENTQHYLQHSEKWLTGLLLRAVFVPTTVYADQNLNIASDYQAGQTFYRYRSNATGTNEDNGVIYFASREAAEAYASAHPADMASVTEFANGRCFYHLWLRHTVKNRTPEIVFPMEYGIVRNHIYRVDLNFHGIGDPEPNIDNPENTDAAIYVRPWNVFRHEQIII